MAADYTKEEHRLIVENPKEVQEFLDKTRQGGASINLKSKKVASFGQKLYFVGKEPSQKTKQPVDTAFEDVGKAHPSLNAKQFASHFLRLQGESNRPTSHMGTWIDDENPKAGVQIDLSAGYKTKERAERHMVNRDEDAIFDMSVLPYGRNIRNEDVRHKYTSEPRPKKEN